MTALYLDNNIIIIFIWYFNKLYKDVSRNCTFKLEPMKFVFTLHFGNNRINVASKDPPKPAKCIK